MGEGSGRGSGRVRFFVGNRGMGRVGSSFRRVGSKKSDSWTTLRHSFISAPINVESNHGFKGLTCWVGLLSDDGCLSKRDNSELRNKSTSVA